MNNPRITLIPIQEIRIVNPRSRNRVKFRSVVTSIGAVGLKKPITVHQRELEADGTRYDLVCGQGRLEAVRAGILNGYFATPARASCWWGMLCSQRCKGPQHRANCRISWLAAI